MKPITAAPESVTALVGKFVRRNKAFALATVVSISVLIGAAAVSFSYAAGESRARAEAERRTRIAESINAFLNEDLLSSVDPSNTDNPDLTVREALDRAAERIEERFHTQPLVEAAIRHTIGETYRGLQLPREGIPHLQCAVQLRAGVLGKLDEETRQAMRDLLAGLYERGPVDEGSRFGEELLALDIEAAGSDSADAMDTRHLLARYGDGDGDFEKRLATLRSVVEWNRSERGEAHPETLSVMHSLADIYLYHRRTEEATPLVEKIWEITSAHYGPSDQETLDAMEGLAVVYGRSDRTEEAVALFQQAIQILRATRPQVFADTGHYLNHLGNHLRTLKRYEEAEVAYLEAYDILSALWGPEDGGTQFTVRFLCRLYEEMGDTEKAQVWRGRMTGSEDNASNE